MVYRIPTAVYNYHTTRDRVIWFCVRVRWWPNHWLDFIPTLAFWGRPLLRSFQSIILKFCFFRHFDFQWDCTGPWSTPNKLPWPHKSQSERKGLGTSLLTILGHHCMPAPSHWHLSNIASTMAGIGETFFYTSELAKPMCKNGTVIIVHSYCTWRRLVWQAEMEYWNLCFLDIVAVSASQTSPRYFARSFFHPEVHRTYRLLPVSTP